MIGLLSFQLVTPSNTKVAWKEVYLGNTLNVLFKSSYGTTYTCFSLSDLYLQQVSHETNHIIRLMAQNFLV